MLRRGTLTARWIKALYMSSVSGARRDNTRASSIDAYRNPISKATLKYIHLGNVQGGAYALGWRWSDVMMKRWKTPHACRIAAGDASTASPSNIKAPKLIGTARGASSHLPPAMGERHESWISRRASAYNMNIASLLIKYHASSRIFQEKARYRHDIIEMRALFVFSGLWGDISLLKFYGKSTFSQW